MLGVIAFFIGSYVQIFSGEHPFDKIEMAGGAPLDDAHLGMVLNEKISSPNRVLASKNSYAHVAVGLPDLVSCFFQITGI